jgi:hypothetical protein
VSLPRKVSPTTTLEVALHKALVWPADREDDVNNVSDLVQNDQKPTPPEVLERFGWRIVDPMKVCPDLNSYRRYIQTSKAEWSVAKNAYVNGKSGWFSCRSACYLAAGRPVIVQDTGFSQVLPVGEGIISFDTLDEAEAGIREVEGNYNRHAKAAQDIAEAYFDSDKVLNRLLDIAMNSHG